jgi:putative membrane protein
MAGAVGIEQFSPQLSSAELRIGISTMLLVAASMMGYTAWRRWRRNEYAMRLESNLPYTRALVILAALMVVLATLLGILLWQGQS